MADQHSLPGTSSFLKACFNVMNALLGIGLITTPYALAQAGWLSLCLLLVIAILTCYTGLLLKRFMDFNKSVQTYHDIVTHTFGRKGKIVTSAFMYFQLFLVPVGYLIVEGDNLHNLFPSVDLKLGDYHIGGKKIFTVVAGLVILPTMWLKDLSLLSYISAGGVFSSLVIVFSTTWVGAVDGFGFPYKGYPLNLTGIPSAISLYTFCYGAHLIFPAIYTSMRDKNQFSKVLFISFGLSTLTNMAMAVLGYLMFGQNVSDQVTLNLPTNKASSKIAIYTTLVGPIAKFALVITPIATAIESRLSNSYKSWPICMLIRTLLLASAVIVAVVFPYFGSLMGLVGAILDATFSVLLPCICYLKMFSASKKWSSEAVIIMGAMAFAFSIAVLGTYSSMGEIVKHVM